MLDDSCYVLMIGHRGISVITPLPSGEGKGEGPAGEGGGAIIFLNPVCSVLLCSSVRNRTLPPYDTTHKQHAGEFFLSQSAQSSRRFLAHISSPQKAFGIQSSQSITAKEGCWVIVVMC